MRIITTGLAALLLAGCGDKETTTADDTGTETTEDRFSEFVYVTDAASGDFTGFESGYTDAWLPQAVDSAKQVTVSMTGDVEDFESGDEVKDATVEIFHNNDPTGTPDQTLLSDDSGEITGGEWPVCTPVAYSTFTDPDLNDTKVTFQVNEVYGYSEEKKGGGASAVNVQLNSVSSSTYQVIPSLLGVSPDTDKGIVAGTVYDVNGDPVEGAQVVAVDSSGNIPDTLVVKYFVDDFPNRDQEWTSADGLFVMVNVPTGDWSLEAYISDGAGGHLLMGATNVNVIADSINISSVYIGYGDGISYPSSCLTK
ncbi:MAG: hypothetical protein ACI8RZ_004479 [Myxococcota bacterium]|jgi:hypothetical protein